jgi:hypothetical protein
MTERAEHDVIASSAATQPSAGPPDQDAGLLDELASARAAAIAAPSPLAHEPYHGRPVSWFAVSTIMAGFVCGGLALVFGPTWWAFWLGVGLAGLGSLIALATNIFEDWY